MQTADPNSPAPSLDDDLRVVMRLGVMLLRSGTTNFRIAQTMNWLAAKLGVEALDAYVTLNGIVATASRGGASATLSRQNTQMGVNADRLAALRRLTAETPAGTARRRSKRSST